MAGIDAPFPWFGGKSRVASQVWERFGNVRNYVEPFFGSGAVLLGAPWPAERTETINDLDAYVANFWRAVSRVPDIVARYADSPVNESDLHARHLWLVTTGRDRLASIEGDPEYYDAQIAGWWVWGLCSWIGGGWCSGKGPWRTVDGKRERAEKGEDDGVKRQLPYIAQGGRGIQRTLEHLGDDGRGVNRAGLHLGGGDCGFAPKAIHLAGEGDGQCARSHAALVKWLRQLCDRLRLVRVCCGDWTRILGPTPTEGIGLTGVFLDPPYSGEAGRDMDIYSCDSATVALDVRAWCEAHGDNPMLRIALCGYEGEGHDGLVDRGWSCFAWKAAGGYAGQGDGENVNAGRERIWFSPHCLDVEGLLFK
jgi:hypothetical protein